MERLQLAGLRPQSYEHPLDSKALDALQNSGGFETLVRKVSEWGLERMLHVQLTGSHLKVSADSFPAPEFYIHHAARSRGYSLPVVALRRRD